MVVEFREPGCHRSGFVLFERVVDHQLPDDPVLGQVVPLRVERLDRRGGWGQHRAMRCQRGLWGKFLGDESVLQVDPGAPLPCCQGDLALVRDDSMKTDRAVDRRLSEAGPVLGQADFQHAAGHDRDAVYDLGAGPECHVAAGLVLAKTPAGPQLDRVQDKPTVGAGRRGWGLARRARGGVGFRGGLQRHRDVGPCGTRRCVQELPGQVTGLEAESRLPGGCGGQLVWLDHRDGDPGQRPAARCVAVVDQDLAKMSSWFELAGVHHQLEAATTVSQQQLFATVDPLHCRFQCQVESEGDAALVVETLGEPRRESHEPRGRPSGFVCVAEVNTAAAAATGDLNVNRQCLANGPGVFDQVLPRLVGLQQPGTLPESIRGGSHDRLGGVADRPLEAGRGVGDVLLFEPGDEQCEVATGVGRGHRCSVHPHAALQRPARDRRHGSARGKDVDARVPVGGGAATRPGVGHARQELSQRVFGFHHRR